MTKLEQKLIELGYERGPEYKIIQYWFTYVKPSYFPIVIIYDAQCKTIYPSGIRLQNKFIYSKEQIKALEKALEEYQKDLEILKECEE